MKPSFQSALETVDGFLRVAVRPRYLWTALFALTLVVSLVAVAVQPRRTAVTLWFPAFREAGQRAELRMIPRRKYPAELARTITEELLLGPMDALSVAIAPATTSVRAAIVSRDTVYVDVSSDFFFGRVDSKGVYARPAIEPKEALGLIRRTLAWNMPRYGVVVTIDGYEPF